MPGSDNVENAKAGHPVLDIAITGSTGMIGRALTAFLQDGGHHVHPIVRTPPRETEIGWRPDEGHIDRSRLEGLDAVIHLAGENIADRRWTPSQMTRIRTSRVAGTDLLARTLARLDRPPRTLLTASAIGYYGDSGDTPLDESADAGTGFLAELARDWGARRRSRHQGRGNEDGGGPRPNRRRAGKDAADLSSRTGRTATQSSPEF